MYLIQIEENAERFLKKLDKHESEIILNKIEELKEEPFRYLKRLQGEKLWRLRVGDYRVIVDVIVSANKILVVRIGKRCNVCD